MTTSPLNRIAELVKSLGILRPRDLAAHGIARQYLRVAADQGLVVRSGRGLYVPVNASVTEFHSLAQIAKMVPKGVICLLSALSFHEVGTQNAFEVWIAIGAKDRRPGVAAPKLRIARFSRRALEYGVEMHDIEGVPVRVFSVAKTVADCFKYRNKIGLDVALEALKESLRSKKTKPNQIWAEAPHRPTRDLDLLGRGTPSIDRCRDVFSEICATESEPDGLSLVAGSITAERIKEDQDYEGVRVKFVAKLENARIPIQIDIGFGDAVTPELVDYPTLLAGPAPRILAYPMETVIAEKAEAMVHLGMLNSRMKDFFDVWFLAKTFSLERDKLSRAVAATFERRGTQLNVKNIEQLLIDLGSDDNKEVQWRAFLRKSGLTAPAEFQVVTTGIRDFLLTHLLGTG